MEQTPQKETTMLVSVLNYSSMTQLLRNPLIFKVRDIMQVYSGKKGLSSMVGSAGHEALKLYYGGNPDIAVPADPAEARGMAIDYGMNYITGYPDAGIKFGKTGNREKLMKMYTSAMQIYFENEPKYHEILQCEQKLTGEIRTTDGQLLPLPASGVPDLVHKREDGGVEIIDNKFVKSFTKYEDEDGEPHEDYIKIIQAQFLIHLVKSAMDIDVDRVLFREIKYTKNTEGGPQIQDYAIDAKHEPYRIIFYNIFNDVVKFLKNDPVFLPNLSDPFDGEAAGLLYAQGLINADMSDVEVMHKVRDVAFVSKKFVASRLDRAENKSLLPEEKIKIRLAEFGIPVMPQETIDSGSVIQYRFKVSAGVRMDTIKKHKDDIAVAIEAKGEIRILAPIPGTGLVGVEVEKETRKFVELNEKKLQKGTLALPLGVAVSGEEVTVNLRSMPHLLIAGATGSGKSWLVHNILEALTKQMKPKDMELLLIDPKRVELAAFAKKPHLREKIIFEHDDAVKALLGLVDEMESRYKVLEKDGKRDIADYNAEAKNPLPYIVTVVDEFADLMMRAKVEKEKGKGTAYRNMTKGGLYRELKRRAGKGEVAPIKEFDKDRLIEILEEDDEKNELNRPDADFQLLVVRLAQMGRAAGIHLIIATQSPRVDVITGLIKANFPTRIALTTASPIDSEVILGKRGAEKLAGKGDMLLMHPGLKGGEVRLQGYAIKN